MSTDLIYERLAAVERPIVFWHAPCPDGACGAWLARTRWPDAQLVPAAYGAPFCVREDSVEGAVAILPDREPGKSRVIPISGRDLILVDWTPPLAAETVPKMARHARSLALLDHHDSAIRELVVEGGLAGLKGIPHEKFTMVLDKDRSGAGLALDCFFPGSRERVARDPIEPIPERSPSHAPANTWATMIALHVEDRDLWRFKLSGTREVAAYLETEGTAADPVRFDRLPSVADMTYRGSEMLRYQAGLVDRIASQAAVVKWEEGELLAVNSPVLQSEIGEALYAKAPPPLRASLVWYVGPDGSVRASLRSHAEGADVAELARRRGGGGHQHAAGCKFESLEELRRGGWSP